MPRRCLAPARCAAVSAAPAPAPLMQNVQVLNTTGPRPVVYADYLHAPGAPTALVYAHYDVQPADPLDQWTVTPPFKPVLREGMFYGRGVDDCKGSLLPTIQVGTGRRGWRTVA